jgi:hypothetical protein
LRRNAFEQCGGLGAEIPRRGQKVVVPLEVEAFPAALEERVEAEVVVLRRRTDISLVEQLHGLVANRLPILLKLGELWKILEIEEWARRNRREQIHERVVRCHERRVVGELATDRVTHASAHVRKHACGDECYEYEEAS